MSAENVVTKFFRCFLLTCFYVVGLGCPHSQTKCLPQECHLILPEIEKKKTKTCCTWFAFLVLFVLLLAK